MRELLQPFERGRAGTRGGTLASATRAGRQSTMRGYWSGAAIMLKADSELRMLSAGRQSLDSALAALQSCCIDRHLTWRARELLSELDRITGTTVFTDLYRAHVMDNEFPNVEYTYERLGLELSSDTIRIVPEAPWGRIRHHIMKG